MLLLNSPDGIGLSTNADIHVSADGQINQFAGDSINLSTQKNLITHVSGKASLFAAQGGIKQVAAKGKFEMQAQSDALSILAKQNIQIISTEDRIAKVQIPADKIQPKIYYGFSNMEAKPDQPKQDNTFKDKQVMSIAEAEQLIEQYNKQELDHLLDEYFPDEIQAMIDGQGVEYDDHINDYEEKALEQQNNPDDAIADHAEEIPLNEQATSHLGFGDDL